MAQIQKEQIVVKFFQLPVGHIQRLKKENTKNVKTKQAAFDRIQKLGGHESRLIIDGGSSLDIGAQIYQWIEYCSLYVVEKDISTQVLLDLNKFFLAHSYLVGYTVSLADLALYYSIYDKMICLSALEKEEVYLNLTRWFKHIQQLITTIEDN